MKFGQLVNSLVLGLIAAALGTWSFVQNPADRHDEAGSLSMEGGFQFEESLQADTPMSVVKNGRDSLTLLPGAEASVSWDETSEHMNVELTKGGVFFATEANDFSVSVNAGGIVRVDSQESVAYVELAEDGNVTVYGLSHPSLLNLMEGETVLNALFVPSEMKIEVPPSKVVSSLSRLRLTKLSKEFKAEEWDDLNQEAESVWDEAKLNYTESAVAYSDYLQEAIQFGPIQSGLGATLYRSYESFQTAATVLPTAKERLKEDRKEKLLTYAMSHLLFGDASKGQEWVERWKKESHELEEIETLYSNLFYVLPGDELYPIKTATISMAFDKDATLTALRRQFLEIESLLARGESVDAQTALKAYQGTVTEALESGVFDDSEMSDELAREYLLLERLLRENADFYDVQYVELLSAMEEKILALAAGDTDLHEERQAFVLSKIQFLNRLFDFVTQRQVPVDAASDLASELLFTAQSYMTTIPSTVAVREWYEEELDRADLAIAFMNSPEFYSYSDFTTGLEAFAAKQDDLEDLQAYIQQIRSGNDEDVASTITLEEATEEVRRSFTTNAISYLSAESQGDAGYRLFDIVGGKVDQYSFEASYDREGQLLYDLVIEGQVRFTTGILLSDLRKVVEQALSETSLEVEDETPVSVESSQADALALTQVEAAFEFENLDTNNFKFSVIDREAGRFAFEGLITRHNLSIEGEFNLETGKVSQVKWDYNGTSQSLPSMALSQLEGAVQAVYEALNSN